MLTKLVLREVEVKTPARTGDGYAYEHPSKDKIDFENPITTIHHIAPNSNNWRFFFESKNGEVGLVDKATY